VHGADADLGNATARRPTQDVVDQRNHGLGQGVVGAVADAAHGRFHAGVGQPFGDLQRQILHATVAVVDQGAARKRPAGMQRLVQGIEDKGRRGPRRYPPANNASREGINDKGDRDEPHGGCDKGKISHPQRIRPGRLDLVIDTMSV
jgi:hypothetical protein